MPAARARSAVVVLVATALAWGSAGCGADASGEGDAPQDVVSGVLLDGDEPAAGVELELLVWPSPQGGATGGPGAAPTLQRVDTDTTDEAGAFDFEALAGQLSPHATGDGLVGIDVRLVGSEEFLARTTVRLTKARDTGVTEVHGAEDLEVNLVPATGETGD